MAGLVPIVNGLCRNKSGGFSVVRDTQSVKAWFETVIASSVWVIIRSPVRVSVRIVPSIRVPSIPVVSFVGVGVGVMIPIYRGSRWVSVI